MEPSTIRDNFRQLPVPPTLTLEDFTEARIIHLVANHVTHVLFVGNRKKEESWRPVSENDDAQLELSVKDLRLVPLQSMVMGIANPSVPFVGSFPPIIPECFIPQLPKFMRKSHPTTCFAASSVQL